MPPQQKLIALIESIHALGTKVVFTIHCETRRLQGLAPFVDHFIYHKQPVYIQSRDKITVIPHGVPVFTPPSNKQEVREKYGFSKDDIILTTTGFLASWKGFSSLLEHLIPWLTSCSRHRIQLLTSYNSHILEQCAVEDKKIKDIIVRYRVKKQVVHITNFLSQQELSERLWLSDVGYLWAERDTKSTSGVAAQFIAARLPVVATNSSHYHDLIVGTVKTPPRKSSFIDTIVQTVHNDTLLTKLRDELEQYYNELNYNAIIQRHIRILKKGAL